MTDDGPIQDFRGEPYPQPRLRRGSPEHITKMNAAREAKRAAMTDAEREKAEADRREKMKGKPNWSG
jgi:hypothetical protein